MENYTVIIRNSTQCMCQCHIFFTISHGMIIYFKTKKTKSFVSPFYIHFIILTMITKSNTFNII